MWPFKKKPAPKHVYQIRLMSRKQREALDKIGNISAFVAENCGNSDTAKCMNDIISIVQEIVAEPPRNCDLYETKDEARETFQKLRGHRVLADVSLWDDSDEIEVMFDWLFAEANGETQ